MLGNNVIQLSYEPTYGEPLQGELKLHPRQMRAFLSTVPVTLVIAGIRGGKTHVGALKTIFYAMMHPCAEDECHLVGSPTYQMSKVPVAKIFKLLYDKDIFPICPLIRYIKSERTFLLSAANGEVTRIQVVSLHEPDRIRGIKCLSAWLDEAAYITEYAWEVVQGRLMDVAGPCWITTTPAGYNWVYDLYEKAVAEQRENVPLAEREYKVVHWNSLENTFINVLGIRRQAGRYDSKTYSQEIDAKFIRGRGLVHHPFNRFMHVKKLAVQRNLELWVGQDFNVDPMVSILAQPFRTRDHNEGANVVGVSYARDTDTFGLVRWLDEYTKQHGIPKDKVTLYPDASGKARSTSGKSDFQIIREAGYRVNAPPANPPVKDRINCVNGLLRPIFSKFPRLYIDESAEHLIDALEKQIYKPDSDPPVPDKTQGFDHPNEALGYMCWRRWPIRRASSLGNTERRAA